MRERNLGFEMVLKVCGCLHESQTVEGDEEKIFQKIYRIHAVHGRCGPWWVEEARAARQPRSGSRENILVLLGFWADYASGTGGGVGCQFFGSINFKNKDPLKRERGETGDFERLCTQLISSTTKFLPVVRGHPFSELFTMNNQSLMAKLKKKKKQFLQQTRPIRIQYTGNEYVHYSTDEAVMFYYYKATSEQSSHRRKRGIYSPI